MTAEIQVYIVLLLSVFAGVTLLFLLRPKDRIIRLLLTFSGGYLLAITLLHLFPEAYVHADKTTGIWVVAGLIFQLVLDFFSHGADHGHMHEEHIEHFPKALFIALSLHAFMEGMPLSNGERVHLLWGVAVHKIPVSMMLAMFFVRSKVPVYKSMIFLFLFACMTPLGSFLSGYNAFLMRYSTQVNALVAGALLHISTVILFESSQEHRFHLWKFISMLLGVVLAVML